MTYATDDAPGERDEAPEETPLAAEDTPEETAPETEEAPEETAPEAELATEETGMEVCSEEAAPVMPDVTVKNETSANRRPTSFVPV